VHSITRNQFHAPNRHAGERIGCVDARSGKLLAFCIVNEIHHWIQ
jgi:hypothetical protein